MFGRNQNQPPQRIDSSGLAPHTAAPPIHERYRQPGEPAPGAQTYHQAPPSSSPQYSNEPDDAPVAPNLGVAGAVALDVGHVRLSRHYRAHDVDVIEIRFRKPTAKDLRQAGNPFKIEATGLPNGDAIIDKIETDWEKVVKVVALLSDPPLPPSTVDQFDLADLDACAECLVPFFMVRSALRISLVGLTGSHTSTASTPT